MNLTPEERETIICFNETKQPASIFTYNRTWQGHLEKVLKLKPILNNGKGGREYEISRDRIKMPHAPRKMSKKALLALEKARRGRLTKRAK